MSVLTCTFGAFDARLLVRLILFDFSSSSHSFSRYMGFPDGHSRRSSFTGRSLA